MAVHALPLHFDALRADPAMLLSERAAELLHRDLQRRSRRYVRPVALIFSRIVVWGIVALKRVLPFQFSSHGLLDWLSVRFLRRCVSREGGELLLRHFIVESALIRFVARNCGLPQVREPDLLPTSFNGLLGHAVIQHDIDMYRLIIDVGESLRRAGRARCDRRAAIDFSMLEVPAISPDPAARRLINLDLGTALCLMNIPFALLTTEDIYEQAVNSFSLDESLLAHIADISGDDGFRALGPRQSLAWLAVDGDVAKSLYRHAMHHEQAHTALCRLGADNRGFR
ncbi:MAG: hypothetical protein WD793_09595 [Steroidobacteraceae bacterium]